VNSPSVPRKSAPVLSSSKLTPHHAAPTVHPNDGPCPVRDEVSHQRGPPGQQPARSGASGGNLRSFGLPITVSASKPLTSAPIRTGKPRRQNRGSARHPLRPARRLAQVVGARGHRRDHADTNDGDSTTRDHRPAPAKAAPRAPPTSLFAPFRLSTARTAYTREFMHLRLTFQDLAGWNESADIFTSEICSEGPDQRQGLGSAT